ncbi:Vacuolar protein sorting-associated protein 74 [Pestalotiopsis sp. IQ-011]
MTTSRDLSMRYSSSPELSDPPSGLSETTSPVQHATARSSDAIVDQSAYRYDVTGQPVLTKDGVPRRKPGPKPGTKLGKRNANNAEGADGVKVRKPRKPRDPNAPPTQRKRKLATADPDSSDLHVEARAASIGAGPPRQTKLTDMPTGLGRLEPMAQPLKRESSSGQPRMSNMSSILNADPEPQPTTTPRSSGTNYDPVRPSYDPVRGTMVSHHSYSNPLASPRAPANAINRASASPSIASLVDPPVQIISPIPQHSTFAQSNAQSQHRQDSNSVPASPQPFRTPKDFAPPLPAPRQTIAESKKETAPTITRAQIEIRPSSITSIAAASKRTPPKNHSHTSGSPKFGAQKNGIEMPGDERSILDFGKSGSAVTTPSIVLHIPLTGDNNKYVNFMRMAEDQYGWDALHPRQAEAKARKARIAAASAALAQQEGGRDGDEMSVDESDNEDSNIEMGGLSGADKPDGKIKKKKRHFKEDEYDKEDDFVDDSEMLWEEQAAASRDGFFVYSGPLVPEVEKPEPGRGEGRPARGRGSRGGRGGSGRGTGTGRGRGGGPGSRGGVVRKPRMTKADKAQMDREKAEREAAFLKSTNGGGNYNVLHPASPQFAGL